MKTKSDVIDHYDRLIAEENDPVRDPEPLRRYMDKWDGAPFLDALELSRDKAVLEIGVGTGRLAVRTAPMCGTFAGIDISPETVRRASENLRDCPNVTLYCADFMDFPFDGTFDAVYSSLTFLHIEEKQRAVDKVASLLKEKGRFVLSVDKNPSEWLDMGTRKIKIYPDTPENIRECIGNAGLTFRRQIETEFACILIAEK